MWEQYLKLFAHNPSDDYLHASVHYSSNKVDEDQRCYVKSSCSLKWISVKLFWRGVVFKFYWGIVGCRFWNNFLPHLIDLHYFCLEPMFVFNTDLEDAVSSRLWLEDLAVFWLLLFWS